MLIVQFWEVGGYQCGFGQVGGWVIFGMLGNCVGLFDCSGQVGFVQVVSVGIVFVLFEIDGYGDVVVVGGLYGFYFVKVDIDFQVMIFVVVDFGLVGVQCVGMVEQLLGKVGQLFQLGWVVVVDGYFRGDYV